MRYDIAVERLIDRLQPTRPLLALDVETTGVNVEQDRIVELGVIRLWPTSYPMRWRFNPGIPIPASATAVHHISDADVAGSDSFAKGAPYLADVLAGADFIGYNLRKFDLRILDAEFARAGVAWDHSAARVLDAFSIFVQKETRDLSGAVRFYCNDTLDESEAHQALHDVEATINVLAAQLDAFYPELPTDLDALHAYCEARDPSWLDSTGKIAWRDGRAVLTVGKLAGVPLDQIVISDSGYLRWMLAKDFPDDTKAIIARALKGQFPTAPTPERTPAS